MLSTPKPPKIEQFQPLKHFQPVRHFHHVKQFQHCFYFLTITWYLRDHSHSDHPDLPQPQGPLHDYLEHTFMEHIVFCLAGLTTAELLCSKKSVPQMSGCPYGCAPTAVLQKVSAPNARVPLLLFPKLQCPFGCAPNAVLLVPAFDLTCALGSRGDIFGFIAPKKSRSINILIP